MPVKADQLVSALIQSNYDSKEIRFLKEGFTNGFDIGYNGPKVRQSKAKNIPLTVETKVDL